MRSKITKTLMIYPENYVEQCMYLSKLHNIETDTLPDA